MLRLLCGAFALACGVAQAFAGSPAPADDSGSAPMRFEWRREGPAEACGSNCRMWISAVGYITADTPREFETFASDPNARGAVLVLDSDGGSVLGTLALGRAIRSLDMVTTIGKTTTLPAAGNGERRAALVAGRQLRIDVRLPAARRLAPLRAAAGARAGASDLARQEAQAGAGIELFGRGAQCRPARHRAAGAIHDRDGRRRRAARNAPCGFRRGSRSIGSPPTSFGACGSTPSTRCSTGDRPAPTIAPPRGTTSLATVGGPRRRATELSLQRPPASVPAEQLGIIRASLVPVGDGRGVVRTRAVGDVRLHPARRTP